jgi:predicted alpha/beta superfamily hydrolase
MRKLNGSDAHIVGTRCAARCQFFSCRKEHEMVSNSFAASAILVLLALPCAAQQDITPPAPQKVAVHSKILNEDRTIWVRLPYRFDEREKHPVLYMTDAGSQVNEIASSADFLAGEDRMPKIIVVGIVNTNRMRDLTPTRGHLHWPDGSVRDFPESGGGDRFFDFVQAELMPEIEKRYHTQPYRIFAGHSLGGLMAIHVLTTRPDLFNAYIAASPALQWDDGHTFHQAEAFLARTPELRRTLFFSISSERDAPGEMGDYVNKLTALLKQHAPKGLIWSSERYPDEDHDSTVLRAHYAGLKTVFSDWLMPTDPRTDIAVGGLAGIEKHYRELSERFGFQVSSERAINNFAYGLMRRNLKEAVAVFKRNVELYPDSANTYDSLAEAYERAGNREAAEDSCRQAIEVAIRNHDPRLEAFQKHLKQISAGSASAQ